MISEAIFKQLWEQAYDFTPTKPAPEPEDDRCVYARQYALWSEKACQSVLKSPAVDEIHRVILLNTLKYFEFRALVPQAHRNLVSDRGHTCIWHVFERTFQIMKLALLSVPEHTILLLPKPPPPPRSPAPPPPVIQLAGISFGEIEGSTA